MCFQPTILKLNFLHLSLWVSHIKLPKPNSAVCGKIGPENLKYSFSGYLEKNEKIINQRQGTNKSHFLTYQCIVQPKFPPHTFSRIASGSTVAAEPLMKREQTS